MTNGNGNSNLKWKRQPAGAHFLQKTFHMVSAFIWSHGCDMWIRVVGCLQVYFKKKLKKKKIG